LLSKVFDPATFGGFDNVQRQHVIPVSVLPQPENIELFRHFLVATKNSPGGAFALDINDARNVMYLPKKSSRHCCGAGRRCIRY
jgi:hypothetical protein